MSEHKRLPRSRRDFLFNAGSGLGALALGGLLSQDGLLPKASAANVIDPLKPKPPHFNPTAKSVIWLFMEGGPSHPASAHMRAGTHFRFARWRPRRPAAARGPRKPPPIPA